MLASLIKIEDFIISESPMITRKELIVFDWNVLKALHKALQPVAILTTQMQAVQYIMGDFVRDFGNCLKKLREMETNPHAAILRTKLLNRQIVQYECPVVLAALYFDPRYNTDDDVQVLTQAQKEIAIVRTFK